MKLSSGSVTCLRRDEVLCSPPTLDLFGTGAFSGEDLGDRTARDDEVADVVAAGATFRDDEERVAGICDCCLSLSTWEGK